MAATWIYTVMRNQCFDMLRRQMASKEQLVAEDLWPVLELQVETDLVADTGENQVLTRQLAHYIHRLPVPQQEVVRGIYLQDLTLQELAERLDVPLGTIKSRLRLASEKLRDFFKPIGMVHTCYDATSGRVIPHMVSGYTKTARCLPARRISSAKSHSMLPWAGLNRGRPRTLLPPSVPGNCSWPRPSAYVDSRTFAGWCTNPLWLRLVGEHLPGAIRDGYYGIRPMASPAVALPDDDIPVSLSYRTMMGNNLIQNELAGRWLHWRSAIPISHLHASPYPPLH